jgi:DNA-binding MarR family transcriptional regulator
MSNTIEDLSLLMAFGKIRRQLNLKATHALKPMGIGPKQAMFLRELRTLKTSSLSELARLTETDPGATGKIIGTLIKKGWVKQTDHPEDRRQWLVSLTKDGIKATKELDGIFQRLAKEFCKPLPAREKESLFNHFSAISTHLETCLETVKETI